MAEEKPRELLQQADTVVVFNLGRIAWRGRPDDLDREALTALMLGEHVDQTAEPTLVSS